MFFFTSSHLPEDCAQVAPTVLDAAALVQRVSSSRHWTTSVDSDTKELETVQTLLKSADGYCDQTASDLKVGGQAQHEENINPNKHPYRYMLQTAIGSVFDDVRRRKKQRSAWYRVIESKREINMREAFLAEQAVSAKSFRTLAHRAESETPVDSADIASYRATLLSRSKKRPSSRQARMLPGAAAAARRAAATKAKRQRQSFDSACEDEAASEEEH